MNQLVPSVNRHFGDSVRHHSVTYKAEHGNSVRGGYSQGMLTRFYRWWNTGDPAPGEIAFAAWMLAGFVFIAYFGR